MGGERDSGSGPGRRSKVSRLIDEYGLDGTGDELERRWTSDGDERASLRELADVFNRTLLGVRLRDAGMQTLDGEVENSYRLITGDDVTSAERTRAVRRLEREGVDVEELRSDFVSYQAIRTYLKNVRGATYERESPDRVTATQETIDQLRGRLTTVTESRLEQLEATGDLEIEAVSAVVDVRVRCDECGEQYALDELLERGRCACQVD